MTLYQFKLLTERDQYQSIWDNGILIADRLEHKHWYSLYSMFDFYLELKYDAGGTKIIDLRSFISDTPLEPYLIQIDITCLLK